MARGEYGPFVGNGAIKLPSAPRIPNPAQGMPWWKIALGAGAALGVGYLMFVRPSIKAGDRRLAEVRKLASDVGLRSGMTEAETDRAFDAYYKKKGYPSYLLSTAPKVTT